MIQVLQNLKIILTKKQKKDAFFVFLITLFSAACETAVLAVMYAFISGIISFENLESTRLYRILTNVFPFVEPQNYIQILSIILAVSCIGKGFVSYYANRKNYKFSNGLYYTLSEKLYNNFIYNDYDEIVKINSAVILKSITQDTVNTYILVRNVISLFQELVIIILMAGYLVIQSPSVILISGLGCIGMFLCMKKAVTSPIKKYSERRLNAIADSIKNMNQTNGSIKMIKINHLEADFKREFMSSVKNVKDNTVKTDTLGMLPKVFLENVSMFFLFFLVAFLSMIGNNIIGLIPVLATLGMAMYKIIPGISRITTYYAQIMQYVPSMQIILDTYGHCNSKDIEQKRKYAREQKIAIELQNVAFKFTDSDKMLLKNVNLKINENQSIALIGETGAGKTTLADIILGLRKPSSGAVLVNKKNIQNFPVWWANQVGYVPQFIYLTDDSIKNNICFYEMYDEKKMISVLKDAQLWDFINSLPQGIETVVGEQGVRLSGGQKQRIGIARALYKDPAFLVLDEATSALDNETESAIVETIDYLKSKLTVLIIAHRLSTIETCDHVYRVFDGKIERER